MRTLRWTHRLYWRMLGWHTGLPTRNDVYLVQGSNGEYSLREWIKGQCDWRVSPMYGKIRYWKIPKGPIAQPPILLTYNPQAREEQGVKVPSIPRPKYFMQQPPGD
jgi:hypothetical protein